MHGPPDRPPSAEERELLVYLVLGERKQRVSHLRSSGAKIHHHPHLLRSTFPLHSGCGRPFGGILPSATWWTNPGRHRGLTDSDAQPIALVSIQRLLLLPDAMVLQVTRERSKLVGRSTAKCRYPPWSNFTPLLFCGAANLRITQPGQMPATVSWLQKDKRRFPGREDPAKLVQCNVASHYAWRYPRQRLQSTVGHIALPEIGSQRLLLLSFVPHGQIILIILSCKNLFLRPVFHDSHSFLSLLVHSFF